MKTINQKRVEAVERTVRHWDKLDQRMPKEIAMMCARTLRKMPLCIARTEAFTKLNNHLSRWAVKPS